MRWNATRSLLSVASAAAFTLGCSSTDGPTDPAPEGAPDPRAVASERLDSSARASTPPRDVPRPDADDGDAQPGVERDGDSGSRFPDDDASPVASRGDTRDASSSDASDAQAPPPPPPPSHSVTITYPIYRACVGTMVSVAQTDVRRAPGIVPKFFPIGVHAGDPAILGNTDAASQAALAHAARTQTVLSVEASLPDGRYHMVLCDGRYLADCELVEASFATLNADAIARQADPGNPRAVPTDDMQGLLIVAYDSNQYGIAGHRGWLGYKHIVVAGGHFVKWEVGAPITGTPAVDERVYDRNGKTELVRAFGKIALNYGDESEPKPCDARRSASPLVIDFADRGLKALLLPSVAFDVDASGSTSNVAWPAHPDTMFVVLDHNHNERIDDATELFGNRTQLADGSDADNGFTALSQYDSDGNGRIDAQDPVFTKLRLWSDADRDGISQPGELLSLPAMHVKSIALAFVARDEVDRYGDAFRQHSRVTLDDQSERVIADVWFR